MPIRILIADDHGVLRAGLRALLQAEPDFQVVGEADNGNSALLFANQLQPDLLLLDISMPQLSGIEITRKLRETLPSTRVLILSLYEDVGLLRAALRAGAAGYVSKRAVDSELVSAIRTVARGEKYIHPTLLQAIANEISPLPESSAVKPALTTREIQILRLIARGHTNRQIAKQLHLSVRTVENHRANLTDKLGLHDRADLIRYVDEHFLTD